jgi:hypothetical protein
MNVEFFDAVARLEASPV